MVKAEGVHKSFGRLEVLKGISLEVEPGEVMCVLGPSGSGKSTFLRCINHLEKIDAGRLWVDGELVGYRQDGDKLHELPDAEVCRKRAEIGMVFQRFNLFGHMTALENVIEAPIRVKDIGDHKHCGIGKLSQDALSLHLLCQFIPCRSHRLPLPELLPLRVDLGVHLLEASCQQWRQEVLPQLYWAVIHQIPH